MKVLVVDDDPGSRTAVVLLLQGRGHEVAAYEDAETAWTALQQEPCDLLITAWHVPGMEELEFCHRARSLSFGRHLEILIITAGDRREGLAAALDAGASDFLVKPFDRAELELRLAIAERHSAAISALWQAQEAQRTLLASEQVAEAAAEETQEQLRASEEWFRLITENARDMISLVSQEGRFLYVSPSYETALGHAREALLTMRPADLVHPDDLPRVADWRSPGPFPFRMRRADGIWLWLEGSTYPVTWQGEACLVGIARDITVRKQAEERSIRQLGRLAALRTIDMAIAASFDLRVTLSIVLDQVTSHLGVDAAAVLVLNPDLQILEHKAGRGFRGSGLGREVLRLDESLSSRPVLERRLVVVPDLADEPLLSRHWLIEEEGFVTYYGQPLLIKGDVKGILEVFHRSPLNLSQELLDFMDTLAQQTAGALDNATLFEGLQRSNLDLALAYDATIEGWSRALDLRDKETEGHSQRVTEMTLRLAERSGMRREGLIHVRRGALLHDIGKMGVPDAILLKPGPLTEEEWTVMRYHPRYAFELLRPIAYLRSALDIPYSHHEKWDGTGYPRSLTGEQIPLAARLFAVVDVWDALLSDRPYRPAWSAERVEAHIRSLAGSHFDSAVAHTFLALLSGG